MQYHHANNFRTRCIRTHHEVMKVFQDVPNLQDIEIQVF